MGVERPQNKANPIAPSEHKCHCSDRLGQSLEFHGIDTSTLEGTKHCVWMSLPLGWANLALSFQFQFGA